MERSKLEAVVGKHYSFGYVVRIIVRGIVCSIKVVVEPRSIVLRRCIQLVMLVIAFPISMQLWTIDRWTIRHRSLRWSVRFVIKLFLFLLILDITIVILILT